MSHLETILRHETKERRLSQLGSAGLLAVIVLIFAIWGMYL